MRDENLTAVVAALINLHGRGAFSPDAIADLVEAYAAHQVKAAAAAYHIPGPYEIALQLGAALAASGRYESPGAAMTAAWASIPEFYQARDFYLNEIAPAFYLTPGAGAESRAMDAVDASYSA